MTRFPHRAKRGAIQTAKKMEVVSKRATPVYGGMTSDARTGSPMPFEQLAGIKPQALPGATARIGGNAPVRGKNVSLRLQAEQAGIRARRPTWEARALPARSPPHPASSAGRPFCFLPKESRPIPSAGEKITAS